MAQFRQFSVDAFASEVFRGNQAAVCAVPEWPSDRMMQLIACENNYSETAFIVKNGEDYGLRWFTPGGEIDLCGHATLASGFVVLRLLEPGRHRVVFATKSGPLTVTLKDGAMKWICLTSSRSARHRCHDGGDRREAASSLHGQRPCLRAAG